MPTRSSVGECSTSSALRRSREALGRASAPRHRRGIPCGCGTGGRRARPRPRPCSWMSATCCWNRPVTCAGSAGAAMVATARASGHLRGRRQHRRAAEAVADQDRGRLKHLAQVVRGRHQIGDVGRKRRVGELAFARAEPGEIEAQHRDAARRQPFGDALRRQHVLAAGEAVREQRERDRLSGRAVEQRGQLFAARIGKIEAFGRHRVLPIAWRCSAAAAGSAGWRLLRRIFPARGIGGCVRLAILPDDRADHVGIVVGPDALAGRSARSRSSRHPRAARRNPSSSRALMTTVEVKRYFASSSSSRAARLLMRLTRPLACAMPATTDASSMCRFDTCMITMPPRRELRQHRSPSPRASSGGSGSRRRRTRRARSGRICPGSRRASAARRRARPECPARSARCS